MMLRVHLAGRLVVEAEGLVALRDRDFRARQERLLFAYLVMNRVRTVTRDELRSLLWPADDIPALNTLNPLLSRIKKVLASVRSSTAGVALQSGSAGIDLHLPVDTWVDLDAAAHYLDAAEGALRRGRPKDGFGAAAVAAGISARSFFPDCEEPWVQSQRRRLDRQRLRALECLSRIWLASGEPHHAIEAASEALNLDPWRESALRLLLLAMKSAGGTGAAVEMYHSFRENLSGALGTDPEPETDQVFLSLLR